MTEAQAQDAPFDLYLRLAELDSCEDTMLVATPALAHSEAFADSLVYVVEHDDHGAVGVIINRSTGVKLGSVLPDSARRSVPEVMARATALRGGPVTKSLLWALHPTIPDAPARLSNAALSLAASPAEFAPIGTRAVLLATGVGTVGWGEGQLEQEIEHKAWVVIPRRDVLFDLPVEQRYGASMEFVRALLPQLVR